MAGGARRLYRRLLRLHRSLPPALRDLGDRYVKEEFRRHKAAEPAEAQRFLREWEETRRRRMFGLQAALIKSAVYCIDEITAILGHGYTEPNLKSCQPSLESYAALIQQQINEDKQNLREKAVYGIQLTEEKLNEFRDEQIGQLKELMDEATKPNKKITISRDSEHKT